MFLFFTTPFLHFTFYKASRTRLCGMYQVISTCLFYRVRFSAEGIEAKTAISVTLQPTLLKLTQGCDKRSVVD